MTDESPINIKVGATANLEVKTEIPSDVTGRAVSVLVDAISPFTEVLGLVGDSIRAVREQRVVARTASAQQKLRAIGREPQLVPDQFLIPWIEKTSQDEGGDGLSEAWENLLVSASLDYQPRMRNFPSILSELSGDDVRFLDALLKPGDISFLEHQATQIEHFQNEINNRHGGPCNGLLEAQMLAKQIEDIPHQLCGIIIKITVIYFEDGQPLLRYSVANYLGTTLDVLESHRLVRLVEFVNETGSQQPRVEVALLTPLGYEFVRACRGAHK